MITTITLNPCVDRTVELRNLTLDGHNRADRVITDISGKGINVSVVLRNLGLETNALVLRHREGGQQVVDFLEKRGIPCRTVEAPGALRINLKLTDTARGTMTEVNERGAPVDADTVADILQAVEELLDTSDMLVVDGSVPPGTPDTIYETLLALADKRGVRAVLDASGELLRCGLRAKPWLVKPNRFELESYYDRKAPDRPALLALARGLLEEGARNVCLSMGAEGAALLTREGTWFAPGNPIPVRGSQGAGDAMVAGICAAAREGLPPEALLRWGVAAAQASLVLPGTGLCTREDFREMLDTVTVEQLKQEEALCLW